jgi:hypothetical protein
MVAGKYSGLQAHDLLCCLQCCDLPHTFTVTRLPAFTAMFICHQPGSIFSYGRPPARMHGFDRGVDTYRDLPQGGGNMQRPGTCRHQAVSFIYK